MVSQLIIGITFLFVSNMFVLYCVCRGLNIDSCPGGTAFTLIVLG